MLSAQHNNKVKLFLVNKLKLSNFSTLYDV